jgi:transposase
VRQAGPDQGLREGLTTFERENSELRQGNEILRKASAYFAQAVLDRRFKRLKRTSWQFRGEVRRHFF